MTKATSLQQLSFEWK